MRLSKSTIFATCSFLAGLAQTVVMTVLPVEAFRLMGSARGVSLVYLAAGLAGFGARLAIPSLVWMIGRPGVLMLGVGSLCLSGGALMTRTLPALPPGLFLNFFAFACFDIVINLYILDYIARPALGRFEAKRIFFSAAPWTLGPWLGVFLQLHVADWMPFLVSSATAIVLLVFFFGCGLAAEPAARPMRPPRGPARYLRRFFAQPRLRLAWTLASGRAAWWAMFQVYAPIFAVESGLGAELGGAIVSLGLGWMWTVLLWGWLGRRYGLRALLMGGYAATGLMTIAAAMLMGIPLLGAAMLVLSALAAETIDGAGNTLYLRAVHPHERSEMTAVFVSYRDVAQFGPPALFSVVLAVFDLPAVFVVGGLMMIGLARLTRHIPRRF